MSWGDSGPPRHAAYLWWTNAFELFPNPVQDFSSPPELVLFDLDSTLFDHQHSLHHAMLAIQASIPHFARESLHWLKRQYESALQEAYDKFTRGEVSYSQKDFFVVHLFYAKFRTTAITHQQAVQFRTVYKAAYRANYRAVEGSVEVLTKLRDAGIRMAILTNGQKHEQWRRAQAIGVAEFMEYIFTSEEFRVHKPDRRIFEGVLNAMGVDREEAVMVGDDTVSDIVGALGTGVRAIQYEAGEGPPKTFMTNRMISAPHEVPGGVYVPVIRRMDQLLDVMGVEEEF